MDRNFVLVGHPRNGSTLLALALGGHPDVTMFGELFNDEFLERRTAFRFGRPLARVLVRRGEPGGACLGYRAGCADRGCAAEDGAAFLRHKVFAARDFDTPYAVGFKLFYHQARDDPRSRSAWRYLAGRDDLLAIHLIRRNLLAALVSLRVAERTGQWVKIRGEPPARESPAIRLAPEECLRYFRQIERQRVWARRLFAAHPSLTLEYEEDLCGRFPATLRRVHRFLGIPHHPCSPLIDKQAQLPLPRRIENYRCLADHFAGSPYRRYFSGELEPSAGR